MRHGERCPHHAPRLVCSYCRHYTDVVLIAVVALCTLENDVIHAGYLALALLFFRRRDELRMQRNRCYIS